MFAIKIFFHQNGVAQLDPISFINDVTANQIKPHLASIAKAVVTYIYNKALGTNPVGVNQAWLNSRTNILNIAQNFLNTYYAYYRGTPNYRNFNEAEFRAFFLDLYNSIGTQTQTVYSTYYNLATVEANLNTNYLNKHVQWMAPYKADASTWWKYQCWNATSQAALKTAMDNGAGYAYTVANNNIPTLTNVINTWTAYASTVQNLAAAVVNNCVLSSDVGTCLTQQVRI